MLEKIKKILVNNRWIIIAILTWIIYALACCGGIYVMGIMEEKINPDGIIMDWTLWAYLFITVIVIPVIVLLIAINDSFGDDDLEYFATPIQMISRLFDR